MKMNYLEIVTEEENDVKLNQHELDLMIDSDCELDVQTTPNTMLQGSHPKIGVQIHILLHPNYQVCLWCLGH
jgi:hypothetical protein